jgi:predicted alpha/beta hydrolase
LSERDVSIQTADGFTLSARLFEADAASREAALVTAGMALPTRIYHRFARWMAAQGVPTVVLDYRGMDDPVKHARVRMRDWGERDIPAAIAWCRESLQAEKLYYVGHSAGGQMLGMAPNNAQVDAMLMVSAQSGYWQHYRVPEKYWLWVVWHFIFPLATAVAGRFPSRLLRFGEDIPAGVAREWSGWCKTPGYMYGDPSIKNHGFRGPVLAWYFTDDSWATPGTRREMLSAYASARVTERHVSPESVGKKQVGHLGFFREEMQEPLWRESLEWLRKA